MTTQAYPSLSRYINAKLDDCNDAKMSETSQDVEQPESLAESIIVGCYPGFLSFISASIRLRSNVNGA